MDGLLNKLFPSAKCAETPAPLDLPEDPFAPIMDEDSVLGVGQGDEIKTSIEYRQMANRRALFSTEMEKIEGFKFSITTPVSQSFMLQNKWMLYPPQADKNQNPMMAMMMPAKTSHYELDMYYIHGVPSDQMEMMQPGFDQSKLTHFRGSLKAGGTVEAMIMKKFNSWLDLRFEGQFMTPQQSQWSLSLTSTSRLMVNTFSLGNISYEYSTSHLIGRHILAGFSIFYIPQQRMLDMSIAGMYKRKHHTIVASIDKMRQQTTVGFVSKFDKKTQIGAEIKYELTEGESSTSIAYQKGFKKSSIKAIVDTTGKIQTCFTLGDMMSFFKFKTYASGNIFKENYKFGYGIHLGMEEL